MQRKYELIPEPSFAGGNYFRVRAVKDFSNVKAGELGGLVDSPDTLSHDGNCWIGGDAMVTCGARVAGDAVVTGSAFVSGKVTLGGTVRIAGWVQVHGQNVALSGALSFYAERPEIGLPATRTPDAPRARP